MNIAVYLGANKGNDSSFEKAIIELGTWIGSNNGINSSKYTRRRRKSHRC